MCVAGEQWLGQGQDCTRLQRVVSCRLSIVRWAWCEVGLQPGPSGSWCLQSSHVRARCTRSVGWLIVWAFYVRAWLGCAGVAGPPGPPPPPPSGITLYPSWPASSPWVTAVGATRFINQDPTGAAGEMATDQFGSGGGFSTMWGQSPNATWQTAAVQAYLKADAVDLPPAGSFPPNGRGTPDVSALGEGFQVIADGQTQSVGGTSASSPTFAGMISVINGARMAAGKPALGFLNPWLYKNTAMFKDVTVGSNKVSRAGSKLKYGWACLPGWDAATGIGTPLFGKMLESAMQN
eukprot:m.94115 g.94115  ORF g.94115 m.94115 type:complete len:292 (+) comp12209_c0_seq1:1412-2287(+)